MSNTLAPPLVSVLMPAYNHAPYVRAAVESVLGQTYGNLEFIVIDDASSDETWSVLQSFEDDRLRLSRHDVNQGAHATLNATLDGSHTHYLFCNNDIEAIAPGWLERMLELGQKPDVGIVGAKLYYPDGKTI